MKIYTKTGDKGTTSLLTGKRVSKAHDRIESYGAVDELNSHVGVLNGYELSQTDKDFLIQIQNLLFTIGSNLADDSLDNKFNIPTIQEANITSLEQKMDELNESLPPLTSFVLPAAHLAVSQAHVCRCVCRRAERAVVRLTESVEVDEKLIKYLNRLSDYFFTLSRKLTVDFNATETPWVSK